MFSKLIWLILFAYFNLIECSPHLRRNSNYYHHRSPYHVNYSPYNLPKRTYFGVESSMYNDLDDSLSNEPVKGGIKGSNPNHIKTPMKLFSERKNSFLTGGLSTLQEKFNEAKRISPSSIKQQQASNLDTPINYPNDNEFNDTPSLPILPNLNKKKIESSKKNSEKGLSDIKSTKLSSKTKITNQVDTSSNNINLNEPINNPQKINENIASNNEKPVIVEAIKTNEIPIKAESNLEIKDNKLENKLAGSSTTEQPVTTTVPELSSPSKDLEIKEIKVETISNSDVSISKLDSNFVKSENTIKSEIKVEKLESTKLDIKNESVAKPIVADSKPIIDEKPADVSDSKKTILTNEKPIVNEEIVDKSVLIINSDSEIKSDVNVLSSEIKKQNVDLPPKLSTNTENSLIENETITENSPIIN